MHIFITGAADGIGHCLARLFSQLPNARLSLVDINGDGAEKTAAQAGCESAVYRSDLSDLEALPGLVEKARVEYGDIDLLINNAGVMLVESMAMMPWEKAQMMVNLDYLSPLRLCNLVIGPMRKRGSGAIINVASMAGLTPIPGCSYYSSAKAGIAMASEIMRTELAGDGIQVLTVYPGPIATKLEQGARDSLGKNAVRDLLPVGDREEMARRIFDGYQKKEARVIYPDFYKLARHFPSVVYWASGHFAPRPVK